VKVVTLRGTYEIDLSAMKVVRPDGREVALEKVPSPVIGERMQLNDESTEPVTEVTQ
jgi:hypothetical protein